MLKSNSHLKKRPSHDIVTWICLKEFMRNTNALQQLQPAAVALSQFLYGVALMCVARDWRNRHSAVTAYAHN